MRKLVATGMLAALLVGVSAASPAFACGCGGLATPPGSTITASSERAIISWDGSKETIEFTLDLEANGAQSAGLIIPTPSPAVISDGDARTFDLIDNAIAPPVDTYKDWWGLGYVLPQPEPTRPDPLSRVTIGGLEATTLQPVDTVGMKQWLAANDFEVTDEMSKAFTTYIEIGWSFTAVTLSNEKGLDGHIDPIRVTFATDQLVYPMRLSRTETTPQDVRLYIFDSQRDFLAKANRPTVDLELDISVAWAGPTTDPRLRNLGSYLTVIDVHLNDPPNESDNDFAIVRSLEDGDVLPRLSRYEMVTLLGIPVGTLLVGWSLLGLGILLGHVVGRRRAR